MTYLEKLRDPRWQKLSAEVKERAEWKCERCGSSDKNLQAHHCYYVSGREPWEYHPAEMECLCVDCHKLVTELMRKLRVGACSMTNDALRKLVRYAWQMKHKRVGFTKARLREIREMVMLHPGES